jgi:probable addiction module antidote protein
MSKTVTSRYDVAEHLRTPEEMAAYFEACLEEAEGDAAFIAKALGDIARAKGMAQVARDAGLSRESLYKALSGERSPDFETILKVVSALGLELHAKVARESLDVAGGRAGEPSAKPPVKAARGGTAAGARRGARAWSSPDTV